MWPFTKTYTHDDGNCEFVYSRHPGRYRCVKCGYLTPVIKHTPPERVHKACGLKTTLSFYSGSRGLGDTVYKMIYYVSFGYWRKTMGCACSERQRTLNKLLPYGKSWRWWTSRVKTALHRGNKP